MQGARSKERECPKCCRVFECDDDDEQFQEENRGRSSTALPKSNFHLKNVFRKWSIDKMLSSSEIALLNAGPTKNKLWNLFLITFLKPLQAGGAQNRSLKSGGALLQAQRQLLFQINCVSS